VAARAAATIDLPLEAGRLHFGLLADSLAAVASLAAVVLALRQLSR
jgi:hypothetical protein